MREIALSGAHWKTPEDFYCALLSSLEAPEWHGHNLDALRDSITVGDINEVNPPFLVRISGLDGLPPECKEVLDGFVDIIEEARNEVIPVEVIIQ